jgi:hypothetical protein
VHHCGKIKSALILLMHGTNKKTYLALYTEPLRKYLAYLGVRKLLTYVQPGYYFNCIEWLMETLSITSTKKDGIMK